MHILEENEEYGARCKMLVAIAMRSMHEVRLNLSLMN